MKLKVDREERMNVVSGKAPQFQKIFKKVDQGLSDGELKRIEIFKDHIKVYIGEKDETSKSK